MTPRKRLNAIKKRFAENQPLNLSAVENECPDLLDGLFEPDNFIGWRATLEEAGINYSEIVVFVNPEIQCRLCDFSGGAIFQHISAQHGITSAEYRQEFPDAEVVSELKRAGSIGNRHDDCAKVIEPHWEPAWSIKYLLDRMFTLSKQGVPMNYTHFATNEPGLAAYCRRIFGSWDEGIRHIGLSPKNTRVVKEEQSYSREDVLKELQQTAVEDPDKITLPILAAEESLVRRCFRVFSSYEQALSEAGLEPSDFIPALDDPPLVKKKQRLINTAKKRLSAADRTYDPEELARFLNRYETVIRHFYISWHNFVQDIGTTTRDLFYAPDHPLYDSKQKVIAGLKKRDEVGLSNRHIMLSEQDRSLVVMAFKHFGNYAAAVEAAGLAQPPAMKCRAHYQSSEEILSEIRRRYRNKESLYHVDVLAEDTSLIKWSKHYYGGFKEALVEAGVPDPGVKPHNHSKPFAYPDKEAVFAEIQRRHADGESIAYSTLCKPRRPGSDYTLYLSAIRLCGDWFNAVAEAGFSGVLHYDPESNSCRYYCKEDIIDVIQRQHQKGGSLAVKHRKLARAKGGMGRALFTKAEEYFGSYPAAVEAAGIDLSHIE